LHRQGRYRILLPFAYRPEAARAAAKAHLDSAAEALRENLLADRRREVSSRRAEGSALTLSKGRRGEA